MAINPSTAAGRVFGFRTSAFDREVLFVAHLEGTETISRPFRFDLRLISLDQNIDPAEVLRHPARLRFKIESSDGSIQSADIHGVLTSFEFQTIVKNFEKLESGAMYRAVLVPRLSRLSLGFQSRSFIDKSVPEIVREVLEENGLTEEDYSFPESMFDEKGRYPKREFVVQHQESDLNFISRLLEHEGIYYYFDHRMERDRVIFGDGPDTFRSIQGTVSLGYAPLAQSDPSPPIAGVTTFPVPPVDDESVRSLGYRQSVLPKEIVLQDYDHKNPSTPLQVTQAVSPDGQGTVHLYGEHFTTQEEGKALAAVRAEEIRCREKVAQGESDCKTFRAGETFTLVGHDRLDLNRAYLLTEVRHVGEQDVTFGGKGAGGVYGNRFTAVPAEVPFRPPRITNKPKIAGGIAAKIDAGGDGKYAELDEQGQYHIKMSYDRAAKDPGKSSAPVRMSQPYSGPNMGTHFPLHKSAEVFITHVNGDPDRPVIAGAVPNPETTSPVKDVNHTQCIIKSAGNNAILFDDLEESERLLIRAQRDHEVRVEHDTYELVKNSRHLTVKKDQIEHVENDRHERIDRDHIAEIGGERHLTIGSHEAVDVSGNSSVTVQGDVVHVHLKNHSEDTSGNYYLKAKQIVLEADSGVTIKCGASNIVVDASGIAIVGTAAKINSGSSPASGSAGKAATPKSASAPTEPGDLEVSSATATSAGPEDSGKGTGEKTSWVSFELKDKKGKPVPNERFKLKLPDGSIVGGRLDREGKTKVTGIPAGQCEIMFPRLDDGKWRKC